MSVKHTIRQPHGKTATVDLTPRKAIKAHCMECVCWVRAEVEGCTSSMCPLFPFRTGDAHYISQERRYALSKRGLKQEIVLGTIPDYGV